MLQVMINNTPFYDPEAYDGELEAIKQRYKKRGLEGTQALSQDKSDDLAQDCEE
jgi:hypothetical protein